MLITLSFKAVAHYNIAKGLKENNIEYKDINTRATYFNSILWSSQIELEDSYIFTYYSLFDKSKPIFTKKFPKNHNMLQPFIDEKKIQQLIILSNGHYLMTNENDELIFWNLKLGLKGFDENASPYIWSYVIKKDNGLLILKIIDGLGSKSFVPLPEYSKFFAKTYVERRIKLMWSRIHWDLSGRVGNWK